MKGRSPTAEEHRFMDSIVKLGCMACLQDGIFNSHVSPHHIDGRTKPGAHMKVIGLCAAHHQQDDTDPMKRVAVHPNKARFEQMYGTQLELLAQAKQILGVA